MPKKAASSSNISFTTLSNHETDPFPLLPATLFCACANRVPNETPDRSEDGIDVVVIPPVMTADSLMYHIYGFESGKYGIEHKTKYGWLKMSHKFDTNEFYEWTKQYCIERVGERVFLR